MKVLRHIFVPFLMSTRQVNAWKKYSFPHQLLLRVNTEKGKLFSTTKVVDVWEKAKWIFNQI